LFFDLGDIRAHGFVLLGGLLINKIGDGVAIGGWLIINVHLSIIGGFSDVKFGMDCFDGEAAFVGGDRIKVLDDPRADKYIIDSLGHINNFIFMIVINQWWGRDGDIRIGGLGEKEHSSAGMSSGDIIGGREGIR
jgi:hypothetical protein